MDHETLEGFLCKPHRLALDQIGGKKKARQGIGDHKGNSDDEGFAQQNPHQPMLAKRFASQEYPWVHLPPFYSESLPYLNFEAAS